MLIRLSDACGSSAFLVFVVPTIRFILPWNTQALSSIVTSMYDITGSQTPRQCIAASHGALQICFPYFYSGFSLPESTHFGAIVRYSPFRCLTLSRYCSNITTDSLPMMRTTFYWTGFPPVKCHTLGWAHGSLKL